MKILFLERFKHLEIRLLSLSIENDFANPREELFVREIFIAMY
jgi:hypothetical protein